jgi:hypothetical protein
LSWKIKWISDLEIWVVNDLMVLIYWYSFCVIKDYNLLAWCCKILNLELSIFLMNLAWLFFIKKL